MPGITSSSPVAEHGDLRAAAHRKLRIVHAGGERQIAVGEAAPAREQHVALAEIDAGGADMPPGHGGFGDGDVVAVDAGVFLDDDGVGAVGDHAAGEDPHRFAARRPCARTGGRPRPRRSPSAARRDRRHPPRAPHSRPSPTSPAAAASAAPRRRAPARDDTRHRARSFLQAADRRRQGSRQAHRRQASGPRADLLDLQVRSVPLPRHPSMSRGWHKGRAPARLRYWRPSRRRTGSATPARRSPLPHDHRLPRRVCANRCWRTEISRGNGRARRHRPARNARHGPDWCWKTHRAACVVPRRASSGAIPGISPVKIAFQPSRNCASVRPMPSDGRRLSKERGVVDLAGLVMLEAVVDDEARGEVGGRAAGVAGPVRHHLVEIDIEHDAAEIEQQHVGGGGRGRRIHGSRLQNWSGLGNAQGRISRPIRRLSRCASCAKAWAELSGSSRMKVSRVKPNSWAPCAVIGVAGRAGAGPAQAHAEIWRARQGQDARPKAPPRRMPRGPTGDRSAIFRSRRAPIPGERCAATARRRKPPPRRRRSRRPKAAEGAAKQ